LLATNFALGSALLGRPRQAAALAVTAVAGWWVFTRSDASLERGSG
jgi:hypothetical protein